MKRLYKIALVLLLVIIGYGILTTLNWIPSIGSWFKARPVLVEESPLLIKEIKQIASLLTIETSDEVVVGKVRPVSSGSPKKLLDWLSPVPLGQTERLVLIVKGKLHAGTDLNSIDSASVYIHKDSVSLKIPAARIQDILVNPSGTEVFIEEGTWSQPETNLLLEEAKEKLRKRAIERGILQKADEQALKVLEQFLHLQGFNKIRVTTSG